MSAAPALGPVPARRLPFFPVAIAAATLFGAGAIAQSFPGDLNPVVNPNPTYANRSLPGPFTPVANGRVVFRAFTLKTDFAVWSTDGTAAGTFLVAECDGGHSENENFWASTGTLAIFLARDHANDPIDLWRSDGTVAGTWKVIDSSAPGAPSFYWPGDTLRLTAIGNLVFFNAIDPVYGDELWRTDGTTAGTFRLTDIEPGSAPSYAHEYAAVGNQLFFTAYHGSPERSLFATDGTVAGTHLVFDPIAPYGINYVWAGGGTNPLCFFRLDWGGTYGHLYRTDGTAVIRVENSSGTPLPYDGGRGVAAPFGFYAIEGVSGGNSSRLLRSDGTYSGTIVLDTNRNATDLTVGPDRLWCVARTSNTNNDELYAVLHNGVTLFQVVEIAPGYTGARLKGLTMVGDRLAFMANDTVLGDELYVADPNGVAMVKDLMPGSTSSYNLIRPKACHGRLFFMADDAGTTGLEPFVSDLTAAGTQLIVDLARQPTYGSLAGAGWTLATAVGDRVFFVGNDGAAGQELCVTEGGGSHLVLDLVPGTASPTYRRFAAFGNRLFFAVTVPGSGTEPWLSDGTAAGTQMLLDLWPGTSSSLDYAAGFAVLGNRLYFAANNGSTGYELWSTDGTAVGTQLVVDVVAGATSSLPRVITTLGNRVLFYANGAWRSTDGTAAGTSVVATVTMSTPFPFCQRDGRVYFAGNAGGTGYELWATDGTPAGTSLVADVRPGSSSSSPTLLTATDDAVWFVADDGSNGKELWSSDGTAAGTVRRTTLPSAEPYLSNLTASGQRLFFFAYESGFGEEPWTCTTSGSAFRLADINPGSGGSIGQGELIAAGTSGRLFFAAYDGAFTELWHSDGTSAGTAKFADLSARLASTSPHDFVRAGHAIWFGANDVDHGAEPWLLDLGTLHATLVAPYGEGLAGTGGRVPRLVPIGQPTNSNPGYATGVRGGYPLSGGLLAYGFTRVQVPFAGGTLLTSTDILTVFFTDAAGAGAVPEPFTAPAALGLNLFLQAFVFDPAGPMLGMFSTTAGMEILVGQ